MVFSFLSSTNVKKGIRIVGLKKSLCRVDAAYREENRRAAIILQERHSNVPSGALVSRIYGNEPGDSDDELIPIDEIGVNGSRSWESERVAELISSSPNSSHDIRNNVITNVSSTVSNNVRNNNTESEEKSNNADESTSHEGEGVGIFL